MRTDRLLASLALQVTNVLTVRPPRLCATLVSGQHQPVSSATSALPATSVRTRISLACNTASTVHGLSDT